MARRGVIYIGASAPGQLTQGVYKIGRRSVSGNLMDVLKRFPDASVQARAFTVAAFLPYTFLRDPDNEIIPRDIVDAALALREIDYELAVFYMHEAGFVDEEWWGRWYALR